MMLWLLLYEFFSTGLLAVGGGMATIPFLQSMGLRRGWWSPHQLSNLLSAAQCLPGPVGTDMAALAGFHAGGFAGALVAAAALMLPTLLVDLAVAGLMDRFKKAALLHQLLDLLHPVSAGLIAAAAFGLLCSSLGSGSPLPWAQPALWGKALNWRACALYAALLPTAFFKPLQKCHPALWLGVGAAAGLLLARL